MKDIDLSTEALQKRREIAEKATPGQWIIANFKGTDRNEVVVLENNDFIALCYLGGRGANDAAHIAANSPDAVIAMIDEIERLRKEFDLLTRRAIMDVNRLHEEADWLAQAAANGAGATERLSARDWREAARQAVEKDDGGN